MHGLRSDPDVGRARAAAEFVPGQTPPHDPLAASLQVRLAAYSLLARVVLGWPKICKLAHALLWQHSICYKRLKLAQLLDQLDSFSLLLLVWCAAWGREVG